MPERAIPMAPEAPIRGRIVLSRIGAFAHHGDCEERKKAPQHGRSCPPAISVEISVLLRAN
ncbi:MAG: hypothetical protein ACK5PF_03790 [bacterium]